jgi:hypothetical protein
MRATVEVDVDVNKVWGDVWSNDGNGFAYWCTAVRDVIDGVRQDSFSAWKRDANGKIGKMIRVIGYLTLTILLFSMVRIMCGIR